MASGSATALPPRVLLVMPDQWARALLRAALREEGYDAVGSRGLPEAGRVRRDDPERGPVRVLVIDHDALSGAATGLASALSERLGSPDTILVRRATRPVPRGEWTRVLQRPVSVAELVDAVRALAPLPPAARHPVDE
jgi:hypothetical protein